MAEPTTTQEQIDLSRTEAVLEALAEALLARENVRKVKDRYAKFNPQDFGEKPIEAALEEPNRVYLEKLDRLRAELSACGVQV